MPAPKILSRQQYAVNYFRRLLTNTANELGVTPESLISQIAISEVSEVWPTIDDVEASFRLGLNYKEKQPDAEILESVDSGTARNDWPDVAGVGSIPLPGNSEPGPE